MSTPTQLYVLPGASSASTLINLNCVLLCSDYRNKAKPIICPSEQSYDDPLTPIFLFLLLFGGERNTGMINCLADPVLSLFVICLNQNAPA